MESPADINMCEGIQLDDNRIQTDEFFETETYDPNVGWIGCKAHLNHDQPHAGGSHQATSGVELPSGWVWVDDWHLDTSTNTGGGWIYATEVSDDGGVRSIWRPIFPDGYVSVGDIARAGSHPPNVAAVYRSIDKLFAFPVGYDLVWRNCMDDYTTLVSIRYPRAPEGFTSLGCVAVQGFEEPEADMVQCVAETMVAETTFEEQKVWRAPESYPRGCHVYQVRSEALHFVALRETKESTNWTPRMIPDDFQPR